VLQRAGGAQGHDGPAGVEAITAPGGRKARTVRQQAGGRHKATTGFDEAATDRRQGRGNKTVDAIPNGGTAANGAKAAAMTGHPPLRK